MEIRKGRRGWKQCLLGEWDQGYDWEVEAGAPAVGGGPVYRGIGGSKKKKECPWEKELDCGLETFKRFWSLMALKGFSGVEKL